MQAKSLRAFSAELLRLREDQSTQRKRVEVEKNKWKWKGGRGGKVTGGGRYIQS